MSKQSITENETIKLKEKDIWNCINAYFMDNPYCLIQHHIDSYNEFYENGIFRIFRENNKIELRIQKYADRDDEFSFKCILYFGGKLKVESERPHEETAKGVGVKEERPRIHFGKPVIYDKENAHIMFPNEARLRNMNYSMSIHYDLDVEFLEYNVIRGEYKQIGSLLTYDNILLGRFPIMVQSKFCLLWGMPRDTRFAMGECRNDLGGYFIIEGKEKTIVPQESRAVNTVYVERGIANTDKYATQVIFTSVSEDTSKPIRNLYIQLVAPIVSETTGNIHENGNILVEIPNVRKPIPVMIVFRALGIITDKAIIETCLLDMNKYADLIVHFRSSIYDASNIMTQKLALQYIAQFCKPKNTTYVLSILCDNLFPHIGEKTFIEKAYFLGYLIFRLLMVHSGMEEPTNRDNLKNKRIELIGPLLYQMFRDYHKIQMKAMRVEFEKRLGIFTNEKKYETVDEIRKVIDDNYAEVVKLSNLKDANINDGFKRAFKGNWGALEHTKKVGIVQDLNRLSFNGTMSHLRKITLPMDDTLKLAEPRKLQSSHWGFFDPIDTPDGSNIGVHKTIPITTLVSNGFSREPIINWLRVQASLKGVVECGIQELAKMTKVFVNGYWCGNLTQPLDTIRKFKLYRRNGLIPPLTSIAFDYDTNIINVQTDSGRLCRPIFYRDDYTKAFFFDAADMDNPLMTKETLKWNKLIGCEDGFNSVITHPFNGSAKEEQAANANVRSSFHKNKGIIDYIDASETENTLIAVDAKSVLPIHTHLDIHPSLTLGLMCNLIPFPENSPPNRNCFSCGQSKQAVSIYSTQFQNRMDKSALVLNYGQTPLLKTRYLDFICREENPYGVNAIVAIMSHTGYNMEDSIIINEGALKRGLFQTTYMTTYETHEEKPGVGQSKMSVFINPTIRGQKRDYDYTVLDDYGIIPENTVVHDKMILVGVSSANPLMPLSEPKDISLVPKKGQQGSVNKTFITDGEEGERIAKVRICDIRTPTFGDKFASRLGQKGVIGLVMPEEDMPFTADGMRPDMIINPHAIPTRMTIGQLVECIMGKACSVLGGYADSTAFSAEGAKFEEFGRALTEIGGFHSSGNEIMFNGMTGQQIDMEIFIGPTYYMRLKHMVKDKINYRERGPMNKLTRQPVGGRANDGGLRIGEMERDVLISHGITNFLRESMMERGDAYEMPICNTTGTIMSLNRKRGVAVSPMADGPLEFVPTEDLQHVVLKKTAKEKANDFSVVSLPYCAKLFLQEMGTLGLGIRIITEKSVPFLDSLSFSDNIYKLKNIDPMDGAETSANKETIVNKLLKNESATQSKKTLKGVFGGGDAISDPDPATIIGGVGVGDIGGDDDSQIGLKTQTELNTLLNKIQENGDPNALLDEDQYEDNMEKWYSTDDEDFEDDDDDKPLPPLKISDEEVPIDILDLCSDELTVLPSKPVVEMMQQQPTINVSPIINIGNEGCDLGDGTTNSSQPMKSGGHTEGTNKGTGTGIDTDKEFSGGQISVDKVE
jgi:DNA-directed RNA polymerase II subunit RPB2